MYDWLIAMIRQVMVRCITVLKGPKSPERLRLTEACRIPNTLAQRKLDLSAVPSRYFPSQRLVQLVRSSRKIGRGTE